MPNCFSLSRKSDGQLVPLQTIDAEMCKHFNVRCDPKWWHAYWYNDIGFTLACGKDFAWQRKTAKEELVREKCQAELDVEYIKNLGHKIEIIDWLDANFTANAWVER